MAFTQSPSVSNNPKIPTYVLFDFCSEDTRHKTQVTCQKTQPHITDTNDTRHKTHTHALSWSLPKHNVAKRYFYRNYVRTEGFPELRVMIHIDSHIPMPSACGCDLWFIYQNILLVFSFVLLFCRHCFVFATGVITFLCLYFSCFLFEVDNYLLKSVKCLEGVG